MGGPAEKIAAAGLAQAASDVGGIISRILGPTADEIGEALRYKVAPWRIKNLLSFNEKYRQLLPERGIENPEPVSVRLGLPLLEAAANEDNEYLQNVWAHLLAEATNPQEGFAAPRRTYIDTVRQLEPNDVALLQMLYHLYLSSVTMEEEKGFLKERSRMELLSDWISLQRLSQLGILTYSRKNPGGQAVLHLYIRPADGEPIAEGVSFSYAFTSYGYLLSNAATGAGLRTEDGSEVTPLNLDEFPINWGLSHSTSEERSKKNEG